MINLTLLLHELLCLALIYGVFARACKTDERVRADVRIAFLLLALASGIAAIAPLAFGIYPTSISVLLLAAFVSVQITKARHWENGVPHGFYKPECAPRRRRCDSNGGCNHVSQ